MPNADLRDPILINTAGHAAGLLLFGFVLILLIRDWRANARQTRLSLVAATLALAWNAGSLLALAVSPAHTILLIGISTLSFAALSLLPAVLLQVAFERQPHSVVITGYLVSSAAVLLHFVELFSPAAGLHQAALVVIVAGFAALILIAFLLRRRHHPGISSGRSESISLGFLLLFTSSFLHFGYDHPNAPWPAEVLWHHVGIPVALILLLRDYRFLLLDTFVRFLINFGLAAAYIGALLLLNQRFDLAGFLRASPFASGLALVALCLSLILFASLRNALQSWLGRAIFHRRSTAHCMQAIAEAAAQASSEDDLLDRAARQVALHLNASGSALWPQLTQADPVDSPSLLAPAPSKTQSSPDAFRPEAHIPLRFSRGDSCFLVTGARLGGRRYLSEDLAEMSRLGAAIVERVERFRADELQRLVAQAELRALQSQINPHFLFNALNTLYGVIDRRSLEARRLVLNLADTFRYFLQTDRAVIPLSEELRIVEAYLEIEALRLSDRLKTELFIADSLRSVVIPILSIQPLVENAVKHGIAGLETGGLVSVRAQSTPSGLRISVEDTGIGFEASRLRSGDGAGLGLENVRRRLTLCYGPAAALEIESSPAGSSVSFLIPTPANSGGVSDNALVSSNESRQ